MKNVKMHENFKKLIGGSKLALASIAGAGTLVLSGCSGCSATKEPASEVVVEASETPTEIEVIETSEQPSEEISEEISEEPVVEAELPELPILDENGKAYIPGMFTTEEVYAAIDKMVAENDFENDLERDKAIAFMIYINSPYISKDTFMTIKEDYCSNITDTDFHRFCVGYIGDDQETEVTVDYLFLDKKQGDVAMQIVNYYNSDSYSREEYDEYAFNYIQFSKENIGYNPINYVLRSFDTKSNIFKKYKTLYDGPDVDEEYNQLCLGRKKVIINDIGSMSNEITFGDSKTYLFEKTETINYSNYHSSHIEKSLGK